MTSRLEKWLPKTAWPTALYLLLALLIPFSVLAVVSFWRADFFQITPDTSLQNYSRVLLEGNFLALVIRSLGIGLVVAAVSVPVAYVIAYSITFRFKKIGVAVLILVMVSMLSSYLVRIYAWKTILGPSGVINQALVGAGLISEPLAFLLYGDFAVVVTLVHILIPYAVLPIFAGMQNIDPQALEASRDLGASPARTFLRVTLPLSMPGVRAAFLFSFILASADYVTPQLVGGSSGMMVGRVIADQFGLAGNPPFGAALSIVLMAGYAVAIGILYGFGKMWKTAFPAGLPSFGSPLAAARSSRRGLPWLAGATFAILVFLYLPLVIVVLFSFNAAPSGVLPIQGLTLRWYEELIASPGFRQALQTSLWVGGLAILGALLIATPAAFALSRSRFRLKPLLSLLILGPIAVPGIVVGVSLLSALTAVGLFGGALPAAGAHVLFCIPFVVLVVAARLRDLDPHLEEAARDLYAGPRRALRTITLPLILSALAGTAILVAALSLDEFIITNFVIGANATLPVYIWSQMRTGITPSVNAIASIILFGSLILVGLAGYAMRRQAQSRTAFFGEGRP